MAKSSLQRSKHLLADPKQQLQVLSSGLFSSGALPTFSDRLKGLNAQLKTDRLEILQVNLGYMCNQTCVHCHVDAGPDRKEIMSSDTIDQVIDAIKRFRPNTLDLTGGAPEMNPEFLRCSFLMDSTQPKASRKRSNDCSTTLSCITHAPRMAAALSDRHGNEQSLRKARTRLRES